MRAGPSHWHKALPFVSFSILIILLLGFILYYFRMAAVQEHNSSLSSYENTPNAILWIKEAQIIDWLRWVILGVSVGGIIAGMYYLYILKEKWLASFNLLGLCGNALLILFLWWFMSFRAASNIRDAETATNSELRSIAVSLETYNVEHHRYPVSLDQLNDLNEPYNSRIDPFSKQRENYTYLAFNNWWILISAGPDRIRQMIDREKVQSNEYRSNNSFDPTNGTYSSGDIWKIHQVE